MGTKKKSGKKNAIKNSDRANTNTAGCLSYDNCRVCRLMRSVKAKEKDKIIQEVVKKGAKDGCRRVISKIREEWWTSELRRLVERASLNERKHPKEIAGFKIPVWWECGWRRKRCYRPNCPICPNTEKIMGVLGLDDETGKKTDDINKIDGEIIKNEDKLPDTLFDPKDIGLSFDKDKILDISEDLIDDIGFDENYDDIYEEEEELEKDKNPESFSLYRKTAAWTEKNRSLVKKNIGKKQIDDEEILDIMWYGNILPIKTYMQMCFKKDMFVHFNSGGAAADNPDEVNYRYNGYVLKEVLLILEAALEKKIKTGKEKEKSHYLSQLKELRVFKPSILSLCPR
ncbi:MAG: hypothetical protein A3G52_04610 [Candidatus Taylorbacteria bacterium RIFCSPLOWO2_12_FULL_43_20]|uniref:Uncharacterized protein n=1 Tax=Candidatus Taylorbacteria bacterium RIFCSPLOWO2_12_FULL_43_20 TaxID=1802332 RepID=A0A1G2P2A7_9BACT|nr:MAG: hypothetical protein A2825_02540 [Candidatus Taylorbacteria bacterium RIFCSPHIGHO2_01_FULL_43_120]OHA22234.1 MAG: hypothetical protein A3B98_02740 [Candidatus Taylorbacteria bacterium RIFCSPHIGHO2_02_FULL_43_55]OHA28254.1 MAG: hypothetical protein A3E92_02840 [Candidatus Taylorbacteria bacterium RIFCSPHIGHO2_12_FULL_42_34]OHA30405.1 MAG: hypothetical protein A3B09_03385 [Candidatus Taylorbacteria bacterium RIFCSPLOWO2_01_FULL_43_83]OHA39658.1 MAG: hypothetical protein A3H58_02180 [Candi